MDPNVVNFPAPPPDSQINARDIQDQLGAMAFQLMQVTKALEYYKKRCDELEKKE